MSVAVLKHTREIRDARAELRARGLSWAPGLLRRLAAQTGLMTAPLVGDVRKSWDVLKTAQFVEQRVAKDAPVLDLGAKGSEILPILSRMGFTHLTGIDLDPDVRRMPGGTGIRFEVGDFLASSLPAASQRAITAISVIEHGFDGRALFSEVSRLLAPGGFFVASFDYWPEKVRTDSVRLFGLDWRIFSEGEVRELLGEAAAHGLTPCGPVELQAAGHTVRFLGRKYTFAWLALEKR